MRDTHRTVLPVVFGHVVECADRRNSFLASVLRAAVVEYNAKMAKLNAGRPMMGAIGAVEDAHGALTDALAQLDNAVDCVEGEGYGVVLYELRRLRHELDDITNRVGQQRELLR